tara:strand:+ start:1958 stop:3613 length:1656 start_codon:yes stop_codon:yes gene_type:complete
MSDTEFGSETTSEAAEKSAIELLSPQTQQGQLAVKECTLAGNDENVRPINITGLVSNISIFEDITKPFLTGRLSIMDGLDLVKNFKLKGQESLTLSVCQIEIPPGGGEPVECEPKNAINKVFRVYGVSEFKKDYNENYSTYILHFVDPKYFTCERTRLNKVYRNSYSNMLLETLREECGFKYTEDFKGEGIDYWDDSSPESLQFIAPNWNVNRFIKFITENADMKDNKSWKNSMFFYQTANGGFRFSSFQSMLNREFPLAFTYHGRNAQMHTNDPNSPNLGVNTQIMSLEFPQRFNTVKGTKQGAYASKMITYDPVRKVHEETIYDMKKIYDKTDTTSHVSGHPMLILGEEEKIYRSFKTFETADLVQEEWWADATPNEAYDSKVLYKTNMTNSFSDEAKLIDASGNTEVTQPRGVEYRDSSTLERQALLSVFEQNTLKATIPFRSDISVGTIVKFNIPTSELRGKDGVSFDKAKEPNKLQDDRYLITRIAYTISPIDARGALTLFCVKESFGTDIKEYKPLGDTYGVDQAAIDMFAERLREEWEGPQADE